MKRYYNSQKIKVYNNKYLSDNRGHLNKFFDNDIKNFKVVESQISHNKSKNILRGFYMQIGNFSESKLITLIDGKLIWFALDLRRNSPTFAKVESFHLSKKKTIYIPRGYAHGSLSLSKSTVSILADNLYQNNKSIGINFNDPDIKFKKKISFKNKIISKYHKNFKSLAEVINKINYFYN